MTVPDEAMAISDGTMYSVLLRGNEGNESFVYKVVALNHPHQASSVFISDKKECTRWMLAVLRSAETKLEDPSISNRRVVQQQAADLREAADIIIRYDVFEGIDSFMATDVETASVVSRALLACGKKDVVLVE